MLDIRFDFSRETRLLKTGWILILILIPFSLCISTAPNTPTETTLSKINNSKISSDYHKIITSFNNSITEDDLILSISKCKKIGDRKIAEWCKIDIIYLAINARKFNTLPYCSYLSNNLTKYRCAVDVAKSLLSSDITEATETCQKYFTHKYNKDSCLLEVIETYSAEHYESAKDMCRGFFRDTGLLDECLARIAIKNSFFTNSLPLAANLCGEIKNITWRDWCYKTAVIMFYKENPELSRSLCDRINNTIWRNECYGYTGNTNNNFFDISVKPVTTIETRTKIVKKEIYVPKTYTTIQKVILSLIIVIIILTIFIVKNYRKIDEEDYNSFYSDMYKYPVANISYNTKTQMMEDIIKTLKIPSEIINDDIDFLSESVISTLKSINKNRIPELILGKNIKLLTPELCLKIGNIFYEIEDYKSALQYFWKALKLDQKYHQAYNNIGVVYNSMKRFYDAIKFFDKSLSINPKDFRAIYNKGYALFYTGDTHLSEKCFREAVNINNKFYQGWYNLGTLLLREKRYEEAITCLRKALEIKPDYDKALNNLGIAYLEINDIEKAKSIFEEYTQRYPSDISGWKNLQLIQNIENNQVNKHKE